MDRDVPSPSMTQRYQMMRRALAGEMIVTPLEAYILFGGDPDDFSADEAFVVEHDLKFLGYRPDIVIYGICGKPQRKWVRDAKWAEDEKWLNFDDTITASSISEFIARPFHVSL